MYGHACVTTHTHLCAVCEPIHSLWHMCMQSGGVHAFFLAGVIELCEPGLVSTRTGNVSMNGPIEKRMHT